MIKNSDRVVHVRGYTRLKELTEELKPTGMIYAMQPAPLSHPPIALKLVFVSGLKQYIFQDFSAGKKMRETKIPIKYDETNQAYLDDEDIRYFIVKELGIKESNICSMETYY